MSSLATNAKHVLRRLGRSPLFTAITLLTLAIAVGANTAIFSILHAVLLKPLPFSDPDRLVAIWETAPGLSIQELNASPATYFTFREEGRTFQDIGLWHSDSVSITGLAEPEQVDSLFITEGVLPLLGVQPAAGRYFTRKDDSPGSPATAMLTYGYWQRQFGRDPSVVGRRITVDGQATEIIGVVPQNFQFMNLRPSVILPLQIDRGKTFVGNFFYHAVGRLKPGVTIAQANADEARMLPMLTSKFPPAPGMNAKMIEDAKLGPSVRPLKDDVVGDVSKTLWVLMGTVGIVLLIACANVANLLVVRAEGRQQELAIRAALGAGWMRIARELLFESMTLGLIGGALGVGLAYAALRVLVLLGPANIPRLQEITIDAPSLLFTLGISLVAGVLFGLIPVFKYVGPHVMAALRQGGRAQSEGRERHRARSILVIVQLALALVLLISAGLMIRTLTEMRKVQPGFTAPEHILSLRLSIDSSHAPKPEEVVRMHQDIMEKIGAVPGVSSVALVSAVTMDGNRDDDPIFAETKVYSESEIPPLRRYKFISPGLFKTMGSPMIAGRDLTWTDINEQRYVVLVSENLAREFWQSPEQALGKRVRETPNAPWREVIGVVGDERDNGVSEKAPSMVYWPMMLKDFWGNGTNVQRTLAYAIRSDRSGSATFLKEVQKAIWSVNPNLPLFDVNTVKQIQDRSMARTSFLLVMLAIAAVVAMLLGIVGIYGVISYSTSQRTKEIGIRMALGAQKQTVTKMFLLEAIKLTAIGLLCGISAAWAVTRLMSSLLFGISPRDPITYVCVPLILAVAALLASYIPAYRATTLPPVDALRAE